MASRVVMPKLSDTMEEGRILRWLKQEGDQVETGQALAEVETDKATVEMEAYTNGVLRKLFAKAGDTVKVGSLIAAIGAADEDISSIVAESEKGQGASAPAAPTASAQPTAPGPARAERKAPAPRPAPARRPDARARAATTERAAPVPAPAEVRGPQSEVGVDLGPRTSDVGQQASGGRRRSFRASPLAARMAAEAGIDLTTIEGSGPQGRVIKRDIEAMQAGGRAEAAERPTARQVAVGEGPEYEDVELSPMRRTIAKRLIQSKAPVPHFYLTVDLRMDRTWDAYRALREAKSSITLNDIVLKAVAASLRRHPEMNASFAGDHVRRYNRVHLGLAVAVDEGLITPVIRDADLKTLEEISAESREMADRARARKLQPHEYTGATFSVSNLGMMGVEEFAAVINPPEAAILAVGALRQVPVVENGAVTIGHRMKVTLSIDHRVADGAMGARFLQTLARLLENPILMA